MVITVAPFTVVGMGVQWVLNLLGIGPAGIAITVARVVGMVAAGLVIAGLFFRVAGKRPLAFLSGGFLAAALGAPALHSWYVQWGSTLLPLTGGMRSIERALIWGTAVMLAYDAVNMSTRNDAVAIGIAAVVGLWVVIFRFMRQPGGVGLQVESD
jgi:hypothetical protein